MSDSDGVGFATSSSSTSSTSATTTTTTCSWTIQCPASQPWIAFNLQFRLEKGDFFTLKNVSSSSLIGDAKVFELPAHFSYASHQASRRLFFPNLTSSTAQISAVTSLRSAGFTIGYECASNRCLDEKNGVLLRGNFSTSSTSSSDDTTYNWGSRDIDSEATEFSSAFQNYANQACYYDVVCPVGYHVGIFDLGFRLDAEGTLQFSNLTTSEPLFDLWRRKQSGNSSNSSNTTGSGVHDEDEEEDDEGNPIIPSNYSAIINSLIQAENVLDTVAAGYSSGGRVRPYARSYYRDYAILFADVHQLRIRVDTGSNWLVGSSGSDRPALHFRYQCFENTCPFNSTMIPRVWNSGGVVGGLGRTSPSATTTTGGNSSSSSSSSRSRFVGAHGHPVLGVLCQFDLNCEEPTDDIVVSERSIYSFENPSPNASITNMSITVGDTVVPLQRRSTGLRTTVISPSSSDDDDHSKKKFLLIYNTSRMLLSNFVFTHGFTTSQTSSWWGSCQPKESKGRCRLATRSGPQQRPALITSSSFSSSTQPPIKSSGTIITDPSALDEQNGVLYLSERNQACDFEIDCSTYFSVNNVTAQSSTTSSSSTDTPRSGGSIFFSGRSYWRDFIHVFNAETVDNETVSAGTNKTTWEEAVRGNAVNTFPTTATTYFFQGKRAVLRVGLGINTPPNSARATKIIWSCSIPGCSTANSSLVNGQTHTEIITTAAATPPPSSSTSLASATPPPILRNDTMLPMTVQSATFFSDRDGYGSRYSSLASSGAEQEEQQQFPSSVNPVMSCKNFSVSCPVGYTVVVNVTGYFSDDNERIEVGATSPTTLRSSSTHAQSHTFSRLRYWHTSSSQPLFLRGPSLMTLSRSVEISFSSVLSDDGVNVLGVEAIATCTPELSSTSNRSAAGKLQHFCPLKADYFSPLGRYELNSMTLNTLNSNGYYPVGTYCELPISCPPHKTIVVVIPGLPGFGMTTTSSNSGAHSRINKLDIDRDGLPYPYFIDLEWEERRGSFAADASSSDYKNAVRSPGYIVNRPAVSQPLFTSEAKLVWNISRWDLPYRGFEISVGCRDTSQILSSSPTAVPSTGYNSLCPYNEGVRSLEKIASSKSSSSLRHNIEYRFSGGDDDQRCGFIYQCPVSATALAIRATEGDFISAKFNISSTSLGASSTLLVDGVIDARPPGPGDPPVVAAYKSISSLGLASGITSPASVGVQLQYSPSNRYSRRNRVYTFAVSLRCLYFSLPDPSLITSITTGSSYSARRGTKSLIPADSSFSPKVFTEYTLVEGQQITKSNNSTARRQSTLETNITTNTSSSPASSLVYKKAAIIACGVNALESANYGIQLQKLIGLVGGQERLIIRNLDNGLEEVFPSSSGGGPSGAVGVEKFWNSLSSSSEAKEFMYAQQFYLEWQTTNPEGDSTARSSSDSSNEREALLKLEYVCRTLEWSIAGIGEQVAAEQDSAASGSTSFSSSSTGTIVGIVFGVIGGIVLLACLIGLCTKCNNNDTRQDRHRRAIVAEPVTIMSPTDVAAQATEAHVGAGDAGGDAVLGTVMYTTSDGYLAANTRSEDSEEMQAHHHHRGGQRARRLSRSENSSSREIHHPPLERLVNPMSGDPFATTPPPPSNNNISSGSTSSHRRAPPTYSVSTHHEPIEQGAEDCRRYPAPPAFNHRGENSGTGDDDGIVIGTSSTSSATNNTNNIPPPPAADTIVMVMPTSSSRCSACYMSKATRACVPCGHLCLCSHCAANNIQPSSPTTSTCPRCREATSQSPVEISVIDTSQQADNCLGCNRPDAKPTHFLAECGHLVLCRECVNNGSGRKRSIVCPRCKTVSETASELQE